MSDSLAGEFAALLTKDIVPVAAPELVGAKRNVIGTLCPAGMVTGNAIPVIVNSELVVLAEETVTLDPAALRLAVNVLLDPTATLPKFALGGEIANVPFAAALPEIGIISLFAFENTMSFPATAPLKNGAKESLKVMLPPGVKVTGAGKSLTESPAPRIESVGITNGIVPELVRVS